MHLFDMNCKHTKELTTDVPKRDVNKKNGKIKNDFIDAIDLFFPKEFNTWKRPYNQWAGKMTLITKIKYKE